jgi:hypothetical protein
LEDVPFTGEKKKLYQRAYMKRRYWLLKAFKDKAILARNRRRMKLALRRLERAKWKASLDPGSVKECELSLGWHCNQIAAEEKAKAKKSKTRELVRMPVRFESLP